VAEPQTVLDPESEARCRDRLRDYLTVLGWTNVEEHVENHLSLSAGYEDRFAYVDRFVPRQARDRLLVSGCAVGSEMIVARGHGYSEVHGTEVDPQLLGIAAARFERSGDFRPLLVDGVRLPHADGYFGTVVSGHVIEHSRAPFRYLREHLRVLRPGGWLYLEFPHRYHPVELHTNTPSVEWLPWPFRDLALRLRALRSRGKDPAVVRIAEGVRTDLRPVGVWQVRLYLAVLLGRGVRLVGLCEPAPGVARMMIEKAPGRQS
jgi:SAM-dependent methyltransferase